jgi:hypothetical protein
MAMNATRCRCAEFVLCEAQTLGIAIGTTAST